MSDFTEARKLASSRASSIPKGSPASGLNGWLWPISGYRHMWACSSSGRCPTCPSVPASPISCSSPAHLTHVSSLSGRATHPYPTGYAPTIRRRSRIVRLPVSRRLSACRRWLLGSSCARWGVAPSSRSAYRQNRSPDPNGVVMLRMNKIRPGRAPPLPRGRWCAPGRRLFSGRHPPLSSGQSLRPR